MKPTLKRPPSKFGPSVVVPVPPSRSEPSEFQVTLELPPSANHLYQRRRGGGVALTAIAKAYRESVKTYVKDRMAELVHFPVGHEVVYQVTLILYFEKLENDGWFEVFAKGKNAGEKKAQTRYKIVDYDNRIKFLQDCVVMAVGIPNDCQIFRGVQEKREDPACPRAEVTIRVVDRSEFFTEGR
jgi:Holliday junction resolvase RusA-like endonuclease